VEDTAMDFEGIGMAMGYRRSIDRLYDEANTEIKKANAEISKLRKKLTEETDARKNLESQVSELVQDAWIHMAWRTGFRAQALALRSELEKQDPNHNLLKPTGLAFSDSDATHTNLTSIFIVAFDDYLKNNGFEHPEDHRFRVIENNI
jgi:hypothetical protein